MKNSKLVKLAWVFIALMASSTSIFAQGWGNGARANGGQNLMCLDYLSNLTENQKTKIEELEKSHQQTMAQFRNERRSTTDLAEKDEIRDEMLEKVNAHRAQVKNLLTDEQKKEYDLLHARGNNFGKQKAKGNRGMAGRGNGAGYGRRCGRNFN